ncbi:hypothetical protein ACOBQX_10580 [Actinokineospora sp. G85]|uniref:hypothetical protein n=1 Tax=Actinokineospora sp. G85 TaxID=3406626 RepID=UPI003C73FD3F
MTNVIPGYPVPVGADDSKYPYGSAAVVNNWAHKSGLLEVQRFLKQIHDWMGHPDKVTAIARSWSPEASTLILGGREGILSAREDVRAYWEGSAFAAFSAYTDHVLKVVDDTYAVMAGMSDLSLKLCETITKTYQAGISFIGSCAQALLDAAGTLAQQWKNLWGGVCEAIFQALSDFVGAVTTLANEIRHNMTEYSRAAVELERKAAELRVPDPLPTSVGETGNWQPRKVG